MSDAPADLPFNYAEDMDNPGWMRWELKDTTRFNAVLGKLIVRREGDGRARVRMFPERLHSNLGDNIHGGAIAAFADVALFAAARTFGVLGAGRAVTLDMTLQFIGGGTLGKPLDAEVELLRETGRLVFERGLVTQGESVVASFTGTVRKVSAPR